MIRVRDIRIGTKLGIASGLAILLVLAGVGTQVLISQSLDEAMTASLRKSDLGALAARSQNEVLRMALAVRDVRLAITAEQLTAAGGAFKARFTEFGRFIAELEKTSITAPTQARTKNLKAAGEKYSTIASRIVAKKSEMFDIQLVTQFSGNDAERIAAIKDEVEAIAKDFGVPTAAEAIKIADEMTTAMQASAKDTQTEAHSRSILASNVTVGLGMLTVVVLIGTAIFGLVSIARPLRALTRPVNELAAGNFTATVLGTDRKDEVGMIAYAVATMSEKMRTALAEIKTSTREVTNASAEIATSSTDLSQRTEEQAASLEQTSAAMEELSATVQKNAENAKRASTSAVDTRQVADRSGAVVAQAVDAMAKIEDSSRKISDIIGVIDEIARQTNLLALNAAVEAARAGDAGRGFAVVASEVRSLAQRSSQAAKDISDLIVKSNGQVKEGVDLVNRTGSALNDIVTSIRSVTELVAEIASASAEQATGLNEINKALTQMDEVTQQNSALVEENAATAKTLEHQAHSMDEQVAYFKIDESPAVESGHQEAATTSRLRREGHQDQYGEAIAA